MILYLMNKGYIIYYNYIIYGLLKNWLGSPTGTTPSSNNCTCTARPVRSCVPQHQGPSYPLVVKHGSVGSHLYMGKSSA